MNKRDVLFIRPSDCRYCLNGFYGLEHVVKYASNKSYNIVDLNGKNADNPYIDDVIMDFSPYLIYGFGHGNVNAYTANSEIPVWIVGEDLTHLAGRIIYLLSCLTANQLGPYLIKQGVIGYGGFLVSWTWITNDINGDPYTDKQAEGFYRSTNRFFESLLEGNTLSQAMQDSIQEYNRWIKYWTDNPNNVSTEIIKWLIHDRDGLVIYGDPNASTILCEDINSREECIEGGCWWYSGSCHCDPPRNIIDSFEFTIDTYHAGGNKETNYVN